MKSGFLTSEFWLHIAALVLPVVASAFSSSANPVIAGIAGAAVSIAGLFTAKSYTGARSNLKSDVVAAAKAAGAAAAQTVVQEVVSPSAK